MKRFFPVGLTLVLLALASPAVAMTEEGMSKVDQLRRSVEAIPENLNLKYYLGCALLENGLIAEAIVELQKAYPAYVDSKEMNYTLAVAFFQRGDLDSSLLYLELAEDLGALQEPETFSVVNLHYNLGLKHLEQSSFHEAEQAFLRVLQLDEGRLQVHRSLGDLYNRMGDMDRSLAEFEKYYKGFPEDTDVQQFLYTSYLNRGVTLLNAGKTTQAELLFDQAMAMSKENSLASYFKGYLAYNVGHYSLAARTLLPVLSLLPEDARKNTDSILYNCALELSKEDATLQEALDILAPLIAGVSPQEEEIFLAGNILMKLEQYEQALLLFKKILSRNPTHRGAILDLLTAREKAVVQLTARARMLQVDYRITEAQQAIEAALKLDPSNKQARFVEGQIQQTRDQLANKYLAESENFLRQGTFLEAIQQVRKALELNPDLVDGRALQEKILAALGQEIANRLSQGETFLAAQQVEKATAAFESVLVLDPGNLQAVDGMNKITTLFQNRGKEKAEQGRIALEKGDPALAIIAFEEALKVVPDMQLAKDGLEIAHARIEKIINERILTAREARSRGAYGEARQQLQSARELRASPLVLKEIDTTEKALAAHISELLAVAEQAFSMDDFKRSTTLYRKVLEIDPVNAAAKSRLATLSRSTDSSVAGNLRQAHEAMREKNFNRALAAFKKVLDVDSANAEAMQGLRDWEEKAGRHMTNLEGRAADAFAKGDYKQSEQLYKEVLILSPGRTKALEGMKKLNLLRGEVLNSADVERMYLEGIALYTQGHYGEAVAIWKKVQLVNPGHVKAGLNIEKAQRKLQSIKERRDG